MRLSFSVLQDFRARSRHPTRSAIPGSELQNPFAATGDTFAQCNSCPVRGNKISIQFTTETSTHLVLTPPFAKSVCERVFVPPFAVRTKGRGRKEGMLWLPDDALGQRRNFFLFFLSSSKHVIARPLTTSFTQELIRLSLQREREKLSGHPWMPKRNNRRYTRGRREEGAFGKQTNFQTPAQEV